jgi:hypothetical protein
VVGVPPSAGLALRVRDNSAMSLEHGPAQAPDGASSAAPKARQAPAATDAAPRAAVLVFLLMAFPPNGRPPECSGRVPR